MLLNGFYGFRGSGQRLGDFQFVSERFSGIDHSDPAVTTLSTQATQTEQLSAWKGNRFANSFLAGVAVPVPANYLQGIDVQTRDFERGRYDENWQSYLAGQWQQGGWWYYYTVGLFWKVPLPVWVLLGLSTITLVFKSLKRRSDDGDESRTIGAICLWVPALIFFAIVSGSTGLNRYVRYALPVLPILFVWASRLGQVAELAESDKLRKVVFGVVGLLCLANAFESIRYAPHHLSYFNQAAGGPDAGYQLLCDSSVDWGQDLGFLCKWVEDNPQANESLHIAYFGAFDPRSIGVQYQPPATASALGGRLRQIEPGWYVVSRNFVVGHPMPIPTGTDRLNFRFVGHQGLSYLSDLEPIDQIGHSMNVYRISPAQARTLNQQVKSANRVAFDLAPPANHLTTSSKPSRSN